MNVSFGFFQFCKLLFDPIRNRSGGIAGLFLHGQHYTRMTINCGIDLITVVRHYHICHI